MFAQTTVSVAHVRIHSRPSPTGPYYDPELHPEGTINLSTAENSLLTEQIIPVSQSDPA